MKGTARRIAMNKNRIYPTYFVFGALLLYSVLFVLPSVIGLGYSFTDWSVYSDEIRFVVHRNTTIPGC